MSSTTEYYLSPQKDVFNYYFWMYLYDFGSQEILRSGDRRAGKKNAEMLK
jgi:hypothetical protein